MELQETVLVSEGEGEGMAVHRFAPDELVIQDAVEDVVSEYVHCDEDEDVAVETCVMALEGEEEGVAMGDIPEDGLDPEQQEEDQDGCGDYLMISRKFTALQCQDWKSTCPFIECHHVERKDLQCFCYYRKQFFYYLKGVGWLTV